MADFARPRRHHEQKAADRHNDESGAIGRRLYGRLGHEPADRALPSQVVRRAGLRRARIRAIRVFSWRDGTMAPELSRRDIIKQPRHRRCWLDHRQFAWRDVASAGAGETVVCPSAISRPTSTQDPTPVTPHLRHPQDRWSVLARPTSSSPRSITVIRRSTLATLQAEGQRHGDVAAPNCRWTT